MFNYKTFIRLYGEALEYENLDLYLYERGWQDWMDSFEPDEVVEILNSIYRIARESLKDTRERSGYSRAEFSRAYNIPIRTLENWDKLNNSPEYTEQLIKYSLFVEEVNGHEEIIEE